MIYVEMTDDIRRYKTKFVGPFTKRQLVCVGLALLIGLPVFFGIPGTTDTKLIASCVVALPIGMCGFATMDGSPLEIIALRFIYSKILTPAKRKNISTTWFKETIDGIKKENERKMYANLTKKQRKKYDALKNKPVKYYNNDKLYKIYK